MSAGQQESAGEAGAPAANPASELAADAAMRVEMYEHYLQVVFEPGQSGRGPDPRYPSCERPPKVVRYLQAYRVFEDPLSKEFKMCFSVETETIEPHTNVLYTLDDAALAAAVFYTPPKHSRPDSPYHTMSVLVRRDGQPPSPYIAREGFRDINMYINMCNNEHVPNPVPKRTTMPVISLDGCFEPR